jgi:hypothetical protein
MHNHLNVTRTSRHFVIAEVPVSWRRYIKAIKLKIKKKGGDRTTPELPLKELQFHSPPNVSIFCL